MPYTINEARDNLSEIIRLSENGKPQIIRRRGVEVAVVISLNEWKHLKGLRPSLVEILRNSPLVGLDLDFSRQAD
ncbi:MAG: type II toxin-antitoxin system Phd/YefM family antitoxin [Pyrinomonadaceae bacterium]